LRPLETWGIPYELPKTSQLYLPEESLRKVQELIPFKSFIAIVPSSAWELKMWPLEHWRSFFEMNPDKNFVILGGPQDKFIETIIPKDSPHILNLAGK